MDGRWWRATFLENGATKLAELETREQQARAGLTHLEEEVQRSVTGERAQAVTEARAERTRLLAEEIARRQAELDDQEAVLKREQHLLENKWQVHCAELDPDLGRPPALAGVTEARARWQQKARAKHSSWSSAGSGPAAWSRLPIHCPPGWPGTPIWWRPRPRPSPATRTSATARRTPARLICWCWKTRSS